MQIIKNQILGGTRTDSQGEKLSKEFLQRYCDHVGTGRIPLHQQHDMLKPVAGYIENVNLIPDPEIPGEWRVVGDVHLDAGKIEDVIGGFSISGIEIISSSETAVAQIYIPFPQYNDPELLSLLTNDPDLNVGKWIKKAAEPVSWAILGGLVAFVVTPIWDDIYKRKIAPNIDGLLDKYLEALKKKGLSPELAQVVLFKDSEVEVRIIPEKGKENECLRSGCVEQGLRDVVNFLMTDMKANGVGVNRIVIFYNAGSSKYQLHRVEYGDGDIVHFA